MKMFDTKTNDTEKAVIFCPLEDKEDKDFKIAEITRLCQSAELEVLKVFSQNLALFNRRTVAGKGKIEEIREFINQNPCDCLVVDFQMTGSQIRNLSDELQIKVLDRIMLIIDIFALNAKSGEGKVEVKLAQDKYLLTRLSSMSGSFGRFGGKGAGMRGPGETKLELDRRKLESEILTLEKEIERIKNTRKQNKILREKNGIKSVVLGGYTNAGKSTIFNLLTKEDVYADDKLFATLDTTTRRLFLPRGDCLLTDTVGFISELPHELVESFSATLEEIKSADLILHVVDVSDKYYKKNIQITNEILNNMGATKNRLVILNKSDILQGPIVIEPCQILFSACQNVEKMKHLLKNAINDALN